jgi:antitoxin CptB
MADDAQNLAKLRWDCRRGMRELDELLLRYLVEHYPTSSDAHKQAFRQLLDLQDPELLRYLLGKLVSEDEFVADVVARIRSLPKR